MKIGLVTIGYALPEATRKLLTSAVSHKHEVEYHLFLHSEDAKLEEVAIEHVIAFSDFVYDYKCNRGLSRSWNEGVINAYRLAPRTTKSNKPDSPCDVVIVVNDDCSFGEGDLDRLAEYAVEHREQYMVGAWGYNLRHSREENIEFSCFAINPIALEVVGAFDENVYPIYFEDCDYSYRARLLGMTAGVCMDTRVQHGGSATLYTDEQRMEKNHTTFIGNQDYYSAKWGGEPGQERYKTPFGKAYPPKIGLDMRHQPFEAMHNRRNPHIEGLRLDIGCGEVPLEGFTGVDLYKAAQVIAPMWKLPYSDGTVDEIYSSHALEHVGKFQVVPTLKEWARVLKPEGRITIRVPDLEWCCRHWLAHQNTGWDMDVLFGIQTTEGEFHKTGFTRRIMESYLAEAGLHLVRYEDLQTHGQKTMSFECMRE